MKPDRWYKAYFFDIDGTLALGDEVIPGAIEALEALRREKVIVRFLSNESTSDRLGHLRRLRHLGFEVSEEEILTTIEATCAWLALNYPSAVVYPMGAPDLTKALQKNQISVSQDPKEIDIVLASCDHHFDYKDIQIAFDAIKTYKRAFLIATNPDRHGPLPDGGGNPDTGFVIAAIEASTGAQCQFVMGKPNPQMMLAALAQAMVAPEDALMVGDTFETDIAVAHNAGAPAALVLTGDSTVDDAMKAGPDTRPTWVIESLLDLIPTGA
ncbi:HAD-IIA family hydrolase [Actinomyces minihominis]|uniref:HAD-IIA family hydrolase n=1 Tax=Actinomyces minihominis TaxID=2002838 RepID=UPI000C08A0FD|nr:HAD-IIA family hydrolase [Actinomyces minihominis]